MSVHRWRRTSAPSFCVSTSTFTVIHVDAQPTHKDGHTLDLVTTKDETTIRDLHVVGLISDHAPVHFRLCVTRVAPVMQQVISREWRRLSSDAFASDLAGSQLCRLQRPYCPWQPDRRRPGAAVQPCDDCSARPALFHSDSATQRQQEDDAVFRRRLSCSSSRERAAKRRI